jgi:hypothetical protein
MRHKLAHQPRDVGDQSGLGSGFFGPASIGFLEGTTGALEVTRPLFVRLSVPLGAVTREEVPTVNV